MANKTKQNNIYLQYPLYTIIQALDSSKGWTVRGS